MCISAILLFKYAKGKYVHVEELLQKHGYKRSGDFSYWRFYDVLQRLEGKREDGSARNGHYRLTEKGQLFVLGEITLPSKFLIYNNQCEGFEGKEITIVEGLGKKFDYSELMNHSLTIHRKPSLKVAHKGGGQQNLFDSL